MNTLFSAVSGQYPKYLIFGTMLPVVIFVLVALAVSLPIIPATVPLMKTISALDKEWFVICVTFIVILLTGFLYNLNTPIVRFYEGYPWGESWLGKKLISMHQSRLQKLALSRERLRVAARIAQRVGIDPQLITDIRDRQRKIAQSLALRYPSEARLVLPTRLGNAIRAFEEHPRQQYGMDTIFLWPRLIAVIPKDYSLAVDDAKSSFDFFLNSSVLSTIITVHLLIIGLAFKRPFATDRSFSFWIVELASSAILAFLFYLGAINRAIAWGGQVKGAFDLYRSDLLKQLGYEYRPKTRQAERELWVEISQQIYYGDADPVRALPLPYGDLPVSVSRKPANVGVKVVYGYDRVSPAKDIGFRCPIKNEDSQKRTAEHVVLHLHPPVGLEYVWDSARFLRGAVEGVPKLSKRTQFAFGGLTIGVDLELSSKTKPAPNELAPKISSILDFELGDLASGDEIVFKCNFMPFPTEKG